MTCTRCQTTLGRYNTSGLCRACFASHPPASAIEKRAASLRAFYAREPAARKAAGDRLASIRRTPAGRAAASARASLHKPWLHSSATGVPPPPGSRWPKLPPEYLTLYKSLRSPKLKKAECLRIVREQMEADQRRAAK